MLDRIYSVSPENLQEDNAQQEEGARVHIAC